MGKLGVPLVGIVLLLSSVVFTSCSSKPVDELKMSKTAMDEARNSEAPQYAPYDWDRARWDFEMGNALTQMGHYSEARSVLVQAISNFNLARDNATRRVESLKIEVSA
jgi:hypothetical protein